ncbi:holo-ACP synthase [Parafilimonas terrae]|jgi:holo-[acyl-carrier protein] synthase|uniref:Holo-[acyl-carrier-protein] synthase n=1 Tax=Parafilimonas terrae TaxID=1465490 RepID=A0A1I5V312_9BACT|nr:holo-ACP synthase [Parafilimonas terrae]SFQ01878.1 holo-[acyl-carrier-protein] synthase [Parafilimonas terrae]
MIFGIGTDIIEVERIAASIEKQSSFKEYVFSANEIAYCESKAHKYEHYAARLAAKEALSKALGTGWPEGTHINEAEVLNDEKGKPFFNFTGATVNVIAAMNIAAIHVSLSHTKTMATAVVMVEK